MSMIDWLILRRLAARTALIVAILFGLFTMVQSLDTHQSSKLMEAGGLPLLVWGLSAKAARIVIDTLPVAVLLATIIAALDLQARREMLIVRATGQSIWRVLRAPLLFAIVTGVAVVSFIEPVIVQVNKSPLLAIYVLGDTGQPWLEEHNAEGSYFISAEHAADEGRLLEGVTVFLTGFPERARIVAETARLEPGNWVLENAVRYLPNRPPETLESLKLATTTTAGGLRVRFTVPGELSLPGAIGALSSGITDPDVRAAALTAVLRQLSLPALLAGMVLIGFAFISGYRRTNRYGAAVLYGVVLGFVVYVVTELASRAGFAGVVEPTFAAAGPAFVAIVIGLTVLLFREDGRV